MLEVRRSSVRPGRKECLILRLQTRALLNRDTGSDLYMNGALKSSIARGFRHTSVFAVVFKVILPSESGMGRTDEAGDLRI